MLALSFILTAKISKICRFLNLEISSLISFFLKFIVATSTKSHFVSATITDFTPRRFKISRCSKLWGISPSFAATTNKHASKPYAPLIIVFMRFSCPGTSINAIFSSFLLKFEKLRSIVMPRFFSSSRLSPSKPFSSFISAVFPWSICPAVPIIKLIFLPFHLLFLLASLRPHQEAI